MSEEDSDPWHERNPVMDAEAERKFGSGVYTSDGEHRERGIFTPEDREYIIGERKANSPQHRSNIRSRQVRRVLDSLEDFQLLLRLDDRTKNRILNDPARPWVHQTLRDIVRFFYEGVDHDKGIVEDAVLSAVWEAESAADEGEVKSVDAEVTIEQAPDPDTALEMFENGEYGRLTLEQIGILAREGLLDEDDWAKLERGGKIPDNPFADRSDA